ncbi:MAG: exopolyphosphatase [Eggerthellaceae bacterium]
MPNYAVIDVGSNSIRMVVYDVPDDHRNSYSRKNFSSIINDKVIAGLASYVVDGVFEDAGINRAISVLKGHAKRARYFKCKRIEAFATAALRNCKNSQEAKKRIEEATDIEIHLLSSEDESHLGFIGAASDRVVGNGTLVDIGGGSTELARVHNGHDFGNVSLTQGSLSSFSNYVEGVIPTPAEIDLIHAAFHDQLQTLRDPALYRTPNFFGIGGTIRGISKLFSLMNSNLERPKELTHQDLSIILNRCIDEPNEFAHSILKAAPERIHTLIPGCVILDTLFTEYGASSISICKYGVREGYLIERMLKG